MQSLLSSGYSGSYAWKPAFQNLLRPGVRWLASNQVTANSLTAAAVISIAIASLALLLFPGEDALWLTLPGVLLLRMSLNAMDGMLAREHGQQSAGGVYWNELGDVCSDVMLLAPFALVEGVSGWAIAGVAVLVALAEMAGIIGWTVGGKRRYEGLLGKSDRSLLLGSLSLWIGITGGLPLWVARSFPIAMAILLGATVLARIHQGVRAAGGEYAQG